MNIKKVLHWLSVVPLILIMPLTIVLFIRLWIWSATYNMTMGIIVSVVGGILVSVIEILVFRLLRSITRTEPRTYWLVLFTIHLLLIALSIYLTYLGFAKSVGWLWLAVPTIYLTVFLIFPFSFRLDYVLYIYICIAIFASLLISIFSDVSWSYTLPWAIMTFISLSVHAGIEGAIKDTPNITKMSAVKDASVVKRGIVGYIVAGPAGAIIGAISAADKNNRNKK